jgi:chromosome segregation ATPase
MFGTAEKSIAAQLQDLSLDANTLQQKIRVDELKLRGAREESGRIAEGLAQGTEKESAVARNQQEIAVIQSRIDGYNALLAPIKAKINELSLEHVRQEKRAAQEARAKEFADLVQSVGAELHAISQAAERLIVDRLWPATEKAQRLLTGFEDLGGLQEVIKLYETHLYAKYPSAEGELHLSRLRARGWKPAVYLGKSSNMLHPVRLTIQAMVPPRQQ